MFTRSTTTLLAGVFVIVSLTPMISQSAINGTISGFVRDDQSQIPLPNASVLIEGTSLGASADKSGFYVIQNVPLGTYVLKAQMIGYAATKIKEVVVKTDQETKVDFELASQVLCIEPEIVIIAPRDYLPQELMNSAQHIEGDELTKNSPIGTFQDALDLLPGVVGNHFRGGRTSDVLYMIDGLPVSGAMTRELSFLVPNSSIAEMVVQTGGFSAEYGNAQAGVVNVVTKEGHGELKGIAKVSTNTIGLNELSYDNFQEAEFAVGGPFAASFGGPVVDGNYFLSSNVQATDSPYRNDLRQVFRHPVKYNYNINAKLGVRLSNKLQLRLQTLGSRWNWHEYDPLWADRLSALPERDNRSLRLSASIIHTITPKMFYSLSASFTRLQNSVKGQTPEDAMTSFYLPDRSPALAWAGAKEPWRERLHEQTFNVRFNLVRQLHASHQFSAGVESQIYDITYARDRYLSWPLTAKDEAAGADYVYTRYQDNVRAYPFAIAAFAQNRFKTTLLTLNLGLRYDVYNLTNVHFAATQDTHSLRGSKAERIHRVLSPRLAIAFPLSDRSHVLMNYGLFYQMPPLFYAFTNGSQGLESYWPILGNIGLKPSRSVAYEATYRYMLAPSVLFSITGFWRNTDGLIDVIPVALNGADGGRGYVRYANIASAHSNGVEVQLRKSFAEGLSGFLNYTYLRAKGTASSPESGLANLFEGRYTTREAEVPLQWDQNHTVVFDINYARRAMNLNLINRLDGPLEAFDSPFVSRGSLPWRYHIDVKFTYQIKSSLGRISPFIEARNLFDRRYPTVSDEGIPLNRANSPWQDRYGRSFRIGVVLE
jgi:outer membrane receptor protein involved in Fe transport